MLQVHMPAILQDYVDHSSVLYKVYVTGTQVCPSPFDCAGCTYMHLCDFGTVILLYACKVVSALTLGLQASRLKLALVLCTGQLLNSCIDSRHGVEAKCRAAAVVGLQLIGK